MAKFEVMRKIDAWVREVAVVEASSREEALQQAYSQEYKIIWENAGTQTFDERHFIIIDGPDD
ncbi:MAG: hypothetical protein GYB49_14945 [Alphaproteobacteria bacterium]|nr:hypothetical protein [Alphaproteobacteria bacterium]|tara:strand:- start:910 stop:1098 length:189 start_codon:yes stop_codon:yes gene_type:complete